MSVRSLREHKLFSQEQLAEVSGLSLRTIQRVEAGHRISYASLRALAATFEIDVDQLERELYAMNKTTDDNFVEIPRWVRVLNGGGWFKGARPSRRDVRILEAIYLGLAVIFLVTSSLVVSERLEKIFRICALMLFVSCYFMSVGYRIVDTYKLWPTDEESASRGFFGLAKIKTSVLLRWLSRNT